MNNILNYCKIYYITSGKTVFSFLYTVETLQVTYAICANENWEGNHRKSDYTMPGCCHVEYKTFDCQEKLPRKVQDVMEKNQSINKREERAFQPNTWLDIAWE